MRQPVFALATANNGKINEIRDILTNLGIEITTRAELGIDVDIPETGRTFYENALIKARAICELSGMPAIADDSGLILEALGGEPGVDTSSFGGEGLSNSERCDYMLERLKGMEPRTAKFVTSVVVCYPGGEIISAEGECRGTIAPEPRGSNGFGYDPIFISEGKDRTNAELTPDEKHEISHRGKALRALAAQLTNNEKRVLNNE